jgi:hypothetical protein
MFPAHPKIIKIKYQTLLRLVQVSFQFFFSHINIIGGIMALVTKINVYGFDVNVTYRLDGGVVEILKTSIVDGTNAVAIGSLDIISEAKEIIESDLAEEEDLFGEAELDKEKPF